MPNTLSKWIKKKLPNSLTKDNETQSLPTLPQSRPRVLTPSPSRENLVLSAAAATSNSAFFQKLPFEIRHKILKEAFGNYTMHMHLSYDFPKVPLHVRQRDTEYHHANIRRLESRQQQQQQTTFGIPRKKSWQWWSSICHRDGPWIISRWRDYELCNDNCYEGGFDLYCGYWPGDTPGKCFIGVMGWLLSCRQSYAECITILYSTNTIHMASSVMIRHLPKLLLPQRLASITSLEMVWNWRPTRYGTDLPNSLEIFGLPAIDSLMEVLESALPRLRQLSIVLIDCDITLGPWGRDDTQDENKPTISTPIDDMVRRLRPRLEECNICIPYAVFDERKGRAAEVNLAWDNRNSHHRRYWREIPCTEEEKKAIPVHLRGYWVCCGKYLGYPPLPCFGTGYNENAGTTINN